MPWDSSRKKTFWVVPGSFIAIFYFKNSSRSIFWDFSKSFFGDFISSVTSVTSLGLPSGIPGVLFKISHWASFFEDSSFWEDLFLRLLRIFFWDSFRSIFRVFFQDSSGNSFRDFIQEIFVRMDQEFFRPGVPLVIPSGALSESPPRVLSGTSSWICLACLSRNLLWDLSRKTFWDSSNNFLKGLSWETSFGIPPGSAFLIPCRLFWNSSSSYSAIVSDVHQMFSGILIL